MLFNSAEFAIFFPVVAILYFLTPHRFRWLLIVLASYYFYMSWKPEYALLILFSTIVDYGVARHMARLTDQKARRPYLMISVFVNLGLLFAFKYLNFFSDSARAVLNQFNLFYDVPRLDVLLPVGISFYTFQTLSYTIDVYRGDKQPETHFGIFAAYVSFFPQLVAGPIERATTLMPQFYQQMTFDTTRIVSGLQLMAWGVFQKVVIADRLAVAVNNVYGDVTNYTGVALWIATYFFAFQIFCDFAGYSNIAIGAARVLGFELMENFRRPYFARSVREFWQRWHISLSTWFRDYLYIPLGGNRTSQSRWFFNLFIVFVVSGLWHGANWTFVIWGALHGLYLIGAIWTQPFWHGVAEKIGLTRYPLAHQWVQRLTTFHLVVFAWIFFRANTLGDAFYIVRNLFVGLDWSGSYGIDIGGRYELLLIVCLLLAMETIHAWQEWWSVRQTWARMPLVMRWAAYYVLIAVILMFGRFGVEEFIYFQF